MKRCPECDTLYEDHVDVCLVDGAELVQASETTAEHVLNATGYHTRSNVLSAAQQAEIAALREQSEEADKSGGSSRALVPLLLVGVLLLVVGGAGAGVVLMSAAGSTTPEPEPGPVASVAPPPAPEPVAPAPAAPAVEEFSLVTQPAGARVLENGKEVCTTPCVIEHPAHAPLPRTFTLEMEGHVTEEYTVQTAGGTHQIRMSEKQVARPRPTRVSRAPRPSPTPSPVAAPEPVAAPAPEPAAPAPAPKPAAGLATGSDLRNPFAK